MQKMSEKLNIQTLRDNYNFFVTGDAPQYCSLVPKVNLLLISIHREDLGFIIASQVLT